MAQVVVFLVFFCLFVCFAHFFIFMLRSLNILSSSHKISLVSSFVVSVATADNGWLNTGAFKYSTDFALNSLLTYTPIKSNMVVGFVDSHTRS